MKEQKRNALIFKNVNEMLETLNAKSRGRYFLCSCPECKQNEAFMYKNNMKFVQCNRDNECGERTYIQYKEQIDEKDIRFKKMQDEFPDLNEEQVKALDWANRAFMHVQKTVKSDTLSADGGYRGISDDVSREFIADMSNEKVVSFMFHKINPLLEKDYSKKSWMCQRNLVFPVHDDDGSVDRILLRSSLDPDIEPKEIQLVMNPSKESRDFFVCIPERADTVVITEAIMDGMSFKEVDRGAGVLALTGSRKTRQLTNYLKENKALFKDKQILVAMDNDVAGEEATKKILDVLVNEDIGFECKVFPYREDDTKRGISDPNDFLVEDRWGFIDRYMSVFDNEKKFNTNRENNRNQTMDMVMER